MTSQKLLLYTAKVCPYAARTELALAIAGLPHETYEVDLLNKPSWYNKKVNKASKVPVLVVEDSYKLPESLVIVEYIEDLTGSIFSSKDATFKASSRYLVERYQQLVQTQYVATALKRDASALPALKDGLKEINALFTQFDTGKGKFILGADKFGYADLNIAPFVARILSLSQHGLMPDPEGGKQGKDIHEEVEGGSEGFEKLSSWWKAVQAEEAWKKVWVEEKYLEPFRKNFANK